MSLWIKSLVLGVALVGLAPVAAGQGESKDYQPEGKQPETPKPAAKGPRQPEEIRLQVGDAAPELKVEKWVKGDAVTSFEKGKVYVVEFWATWCGPCIKSIPHLTELQKQYKDKGVKFIGVSIWEPAKPVEEGSCLDRVTQFVKDQGEKMDYTIAYGGDEAVTSTTWMQAAAQNGIPTAFLINRQGRIAWIGHPGLLEKPLGEVVAGTYDMNGAAERSAKEATMAKKSRLLATRLNDAIKNENKDELVKVTGEFLELDPEQFHPLIPQTFRTLLVDMKDEKAAYEYAQKVSQGAAKDLPLPLNAIAWMILDDDAVAHRNCDVAMTLALRADELTKHENSAILDTLARAYFEKGDAAKAAETEARAIDTFDEKDGSPGEKADMARALAKYKAAAK